MAERLTEEALAYMDTIREEEEVSGDHTVGASPFEQIPHTAWYASSDTKSFIPSPVDLIQEYIMQPAANFNRGLGAGATFGATEGLRSLVQGDDYVPPEGMGYMAGDILGGSVSGAPAFGAVKKGLAAARLINPNKVSRLQRVGTAATEGAVTGGLRGLLDPNLDAGEGVAAGGIIGGGMSGILNAAGAVGKGVIRYASSPKAYKVRQEVIEAGREYGIPLIATARSVGNSFAEWLENKAAQTSAAHQELRKFLHEVDIGMDRFRVDVLDGMADFKAYRQNEDAGRDLLNKFSKYVFTDLKDEASDIYSYVMKKGGKEFESVDTTTLVDDINKVMDKWQNVASPQATRVRNFIDRLMPSDSQQKFQHEMRMGRYDWKDLEEGGMDPRAENVEISLRELWRNATDLYPKKKFGWEDDDFLLMEVSGMVRKHVRKLAGLHPEAGAEFDEMFKRADGMWRKHKEVLETDFGKNFMKMKNNPSKVVDNLAKDIESVRAARETMGDRFTNVLAQRKFMNLMEEAMEDLSDPDVVSKLTGPRKAGDKHFNYFKFAELLSDLGGSPDNARRYRDLLLKTIPTEAREAVEKFLRVAKAIAGPYRRLHPKKEMMAGGAEVASVPVALSSFERFGRILLQFATGKQVAESFVTAGAKTNPLLGGRIPLSPEVGVRGTGERILRRGAQGIQRQFQDNDRDNY
jgi:hypothetical protein